MVAMMTPDSRVRGQSPAAVDGSPTGLRVTVRGNEALPEWDSFVRSAGRAAGFLQTTAWAEVDAAATDAAAYVIEVRDAAGQLKAGSLVALRLESRRLGLGLRVTRRVITCGDGPVVPNGNAQLLSRVLDGVEALRRTRRAMIVRLGPFPTASGWAADPTLSAVYVGRGYVPRPWCTSIVDLSSSEQELFSRLKRSGRKAVRRAASAGVDVAICRTRTEFLDRVVGPYRQWKSPSEDYDAKALAMWDADRSGCYRFFIATLRDQVVATLGTYRTNGVATEIMSGRSPNVPSGVPVQDAVHWHALVTHRQLGDRLFDLAGFNPEPATQKEEGIRRFKEKWGGQTVHTLRFERIHRNPLAVGRISRR